MKTEHTHILLVDDEPDILEILEYNLSKEGYQINIAGSGREAIQKAQEHTPNLIILDVMMPQMNGIETCEQMREIPALKNTIITFLTARAEDHSQMAGFHAGADDYITKPIKPKILVSKVNALLRRLKTEGSDHLIKVGDLTIDLDEYNVNKGNRKIRLPRKEFELLSLLASKPNKVFSREDILTAVWGSEVIVGDRTIDVHIRKLREKIGGENFKTVKGVGYKYVA